MKTGQDDDIETGSSSRRAPAECLDGSKTWHPTCLRVSAILVNLAYSTLAIVGLVAVAKEERDSDVKAVLAFMGSLLIAAATGLLGSALFHNTLLIMANVIYILFLIVYVPLGLGYAKDPMALVFTLLLLIPIFLQTKILYLSREPPSPSQSPNPARARLFSAPGKDYLDGSRPWHSVCVRTFAVLVNLGFMVLSIILLVDLTSEYQKRESDYVFYHKYQTQPITFKLAYSLGGSLLYLSLKGLVASLLLSPYLLIATSIQYPLEVIFYVSVGTYYNLPRLFGFGLALIVPPVLLGKLYMMTLPAEGVTTTTATRTTVNDTRRSNPPPPRNRSARQSQPYPSLNESSRRESIGRGQSPSPKASTTSSKQTAQQPKRQSTRKKSNTNNSRKPQSKSTRRMPMDEDLPSPPPSKRRSSQMNNKK